LIALRFGVPALNLAYTNKCFDIFDDLDLSRNLVPLEAYMRSPQTVVEHAKILIGDRALRPRLRQSVNEYVDRNESVLRRFFGAKTGLIESPVSNRIGEVPRV
jgi:hypothetical protein